MTDNERNGEIMLHKEKINLTLLCYTAQEISMKTASTKYQEFGKDLRAIPDTPEQR